eukprot:TRINITY_DN59_c0_g1_i1.p1 TRINITY_DN59_c0_g1~~TRINITY_DN59_c0_g1_i1.p1  ORF type:complete len:381 (+),score=171.16 TRINITY_DN59_c0_g1_i1:136-1278(+)
MPTSKPPNIDAQRILAIMDELKEKLGYLSVVTSQVLDGLQSEEGQAACELLGPDLMRQFSEQIRLEDLYVVANETAAHGEETEDQREDLKSLQKNTLELCRKMKSVPNVVTELRNYQETRPGAVIQFLKTLADMQELTLKRLTTTVEEEHSRAELLAYYKSREEEATKRRQQLERDLSHIRRECEKSQSQRTEILTKLKADLLDVKDSKLERMSGLRTRYENRMKERHEAFKQRKEDLENRIRKLQESNDKLRKEYKDDETAKKKLVKRYEMEVEGVIKQYDSQVKDMAYMLNEHQELQKKEQKQLQELREHFEKVDAEKECILNEESIADARRQKLEADKTRKTHAAEKVQAFWKGIIQREIFKVEKLKRKKKGKGKKK